MKLTSSCWCVIVVVVIVIGAKATKRIRALGIVALGIVALAEASKSTTTERHRDTTNTKRVGSMIRF